jgi:hypothetical protein
MQREICFAAAVVYDHAYAQQRLLMAVYFAAAFG